VFRDAQTPAGNEPQVTRATTVSGTLVRAIGRLFADATKEAA
jgi:hypothetical protein